MPEGWSKAHQTIYEDATGQSIAASGTYKTAAIDIRGLDELKIMTELTYHASATLGGRVDIIPLMLDDITESTDIYCTAVAPSFAAGGTKSKMSPPVETNEFRYIKLAVVNLDTAQALTLKKLYIY